MKKILSLLLVAGMFAFVACSEEAATEEGDTTTEEAPAEDEAADETADATADEADDMVADAAPEHACGDKCAEGCTGPQCGENGHECSDACMAGMEETEEISSDDEMDV